MGVTLDLFAGPGGWDEGARMAGYDGEILGFEWDADACATAEAAGHARAQTDVAAFDPRDTGVELDGIIASPPCQGFSSAGKGAGRRDAEHLLAAVRAVRTYDDVVAAIAALRETMEDPRSVLALEPLRYVLAMSPKWTTWEQVPAVLPIWEACAEVLRAAGYTVVTAKLSAEQYGVPQTRQRAVLIARRGDQPAAELPTPTHSRYHSRDRAKLDPGVRPWVSMAQALGWGMDARPYPTVTAGATSGGGQDPAMLGGAGARRTVDREEDAGRWVQRSRFSAPPGEGRTTAAERDRTERPLEDPSLTVTGGGFRWRFRNGTGTNAAVRPLDTPAPTVHFGGRLNTVSWEPDPDGLTERDRAILAAARQDGWTGDADTVLDAHDNPDRTRPRPASEPARTIKASRPGNLRWFAGAGVAGLAQPRPDSEPAHTITGKGTAAWIEQRPATTVQGDPRIWPPGHKVNADDRRRDPAADEKYGDRAGTDAVRVTPAQAGVLQSFPPDYPWQGTRTSQHQQIGNAVPPLMAEAVLRPLVDEPSTMVKDMGTGMVARHGPRPPRQPGDPAFTITTHESGTRYHFEGTATGEQRRVTIVEAAVLQSFRPDYPWQGTRTAQFQQVGNAVPPVLAAAILRPILENP